MSFDVAAESYRSFMGRYSEPLAVQFVEFAQVRAGQRAVDVGCGPGALTVPLVAVLGARQVAAIDPSGPFVAALQARLPEVDVRTGVAEHLPWPDDSFDVGLAQLVVHFMSDPGQGLAELHRVTRQGGTVAANVWDLAGDRGPVSTFWRAARDVHGAVRDESELPGTRKGHLTELFSRAGFAEIVSGELTVRLRYARFEDWWEPFTLGVGPAGSFLASLDDDDVAEVREHCRELLPAAPFDIGGTAWCARAQV